MNDSNRRSLGEPTNRAPAAAQHAVVNSQKYVGNDEMSGYGYPMYDSPDDPRWSVDVFPSIVPLRLGPERAGRPTRSVLS